MYLLPQQEFSLPFKLLSEGYLVAFSRLSSGK
jgi:hypothetical protein